MEESDTADLVAHIKKDFLGNATFKNICWKPVLNNLELQNRIIQNTTRLQIVLAYPISVNYQKMFLKQLINFLEKGGSEIDGCLYEEYGRLVGLPDNSADYKHYYLNKLSAYISLKESNSLISDGTTGLRTWQASLALSEWILLNTSEFKGKRILELGSGMGLIGLVTILSSSPKSYIFSDCHKAVLSTLSDNVTLNLRVNKPAYETATCDSIAQVVDLPWEEITQSRCADFKEIDIIIGADIVYDQTVFQALFTAVHCLFSYSNVQKFILSCTVRNSDTLDAFISLLESNYNWDELEFAEQNNFAWPDIPPVKIFSITKK